jgi:hypothetical protein
MTRLLAVYKISLVLLISLTLVYAFQGYYPDFISFFSNIVIPLLACGAAVSSAFSLRKYWHKIRERFSIIWLFFTIGIFMWFIGEAIWAYYALVLGVEIPYPSIADAFWLFGYIPFFAAVYLYVKIFEPVLSRQILTISLIISVIVTVLVSVTVIAPLIGREEDLIAQVVDFAYPILDLALLSVAILGLLIFVKGNIGKSWALINAGILLNTWAEVLFVYMTSPSQNTYYNGHPIDLLYAVAYVFFLLAFYVHSKEL